MQAKKPSRSYETAVIFLFEFLSPHETTNYWCCKAQKYIVPEKHLTCMKQIQDKQALSFDNKWYFVVYI